jgi:hypothetical protein
MIFSNRHLKYGGPGAPIAIAAEFADIQIQLALVSAEWLQQLERNKAKTDARRKCYIGERRSILKIS